MRAVVFRSSWLRLFRVVLVCTAVVALARSSFAEIQSADGPVRLKTYCYALRAALALVWIRQLRQPAPMDLPRLLAVLPAESSLRRAIDELVARKALAGEGDLGPRLTAIDDFLVECLETAAERPASTGSPVSTSRTP